MKTFECNTEPGFTSDPADVQQTCRKYHAAQKREKKGQPNPEKTEQPCRFIARSEGDYLEFSFLRTEASTVPFHVKFLIEQVDGGPGCPAYRLTDVNEKNSKTKIFWLVRYPHYPRAMHFVSNAGIVEPFGPFYVAEDDDGSLVLFYELGSAVKAMGLEDFIEELKQPALTCLRQVDWHSKMPKLGGAARKVTSACMQIEGSKRDGRVCKGTLKRNTREYAVALAKKTAERRKAQAEKVAMEKAAKKASKK